MSILGFGIGLYPSWNFSGGGNMRSLLTLLHGTGLGFTLSHFPVLGGGVGSFHWFINNWISCPLVSLLRSFFFIFSIPILMVLSLSPFWVESLYGPSYLYYMVLSLSPFWVESLCSYPYVYTIVTFL